MSKSGKNRSARDVLLSSVDWISVSRRFFIRCFMKMNVAVNMAIHSNILNGRSEEHTSELQSHSDLVCRLLLEKKKQHTACHAKHDTAQKTDHHDSRQPAQAVTVQA